MPPVLHLIVQYCNSPRADRQAEYDYCLRRNLANPAIIMVHNLVEPQTTVPDEFRRHPKYAPYPIDHWITYHDAFEFANRYLPGEVCCITNLDIFLDDAATDWEGISSPVHGNIVFCLSRTEFDLPAVTFKDPEFLALAFANSQDAWIFQAPFQVPDCNFEMGTLGCDNAIAERIKRAGRLPVNSPNRFKVFHFDRCRGKTGSNQHLVHAAERAARTQQYPEEQGQYLVPDGDQFTSLDAVLDLLKVPRLQRYSALCDVISRFVHIDNRRRAPSAASPGVVAASGAPDAAGHPPLQRLVFFNHWHNGDIYLSRALIEDLIRRFPDLEFAYSHSCSPDLLADIERLAFDPHPLQHLPPNLPCHIDPATATGFINTWIGVHGIPGVHQRGGVSIQLLHETLAPAIKSVLGVDPLPLPQCLPNPRFDKFSIRAIDQFVHADPRPKVLFANGQIRSEQSGQFDFTALIDRLADRFPDFLFIPTNALPLRRPNVRGSADIIQKGGSDLNENGYLSTFCEVIVGRSSGAYTFCFHPANFRAPKTFVGFVKFPGEASLGFDAPFFNPRCRFISSQNYDPDAMFTLLGDVIAPLRRA